MPTFEAPDFYDLDALLTPDERQIRDTVRTWVDERFLPIVAQHYRAGTFPMDLVPELAQLDVFGPSIKGHGCAGLGSVTAGLIMQELERGDSGLRTFASVQGSLAMTAIDLFGSEEQKNRWLPGMAQGTKLGCFALTEPQFGSNPGGLRCRARKTTDGYRLSGAKRWIGNGTIADVAVVWAKVDGESEVDPESPDAIRGFLVEKGTPGFTARLIEGKLSLRAALTAELEFNDCALSAGALLPHSGGLRSPLDLSQPCSLRNRLGGDWGRDGVLRRSAAIRDAPRTIRTTHRQLPARAGETGPHADRDNQGSVAGSSPGAAQRCWRGEALPHLDGQDEQRGDGARYRPRPHATFWVPSASSTSTQSFRHMCNLESVKTYEGTHDIHLLVLGQQITGIPAFS